MDELKSLNELKDEDEKRNDTWVLERAVKNLISRVNEITYRLNRLAE